MGIIYDPYVITYDPYVITEEKNTDPYFPFIGLSCVNIAENPFKVWDKVKKRSLE